MIKIFENHLLLYSCTMIILFLRQIVDVNAAGTSCDPEAPFYECSDGKRHTIKNKTYNLTISQEESPDSAPIAALYVRKKGTIVDASQITVLGNSPDTISTYGAYVTDGGELILTNSHFKDTPGLRAQDAVISMTDGSIQGSSQAVYASGGEADIALVRVNVEIEPGNLNTKNIGIVSGFGAFVRISGSTVNFKESGSFLTRFGGRYLLDNTTINGQGKKESSIVGDRDVSLLPEAFEVYQGGDVHLRGVSLQLTDMHGFVIKNFSGFINSRGQLIQQYGSSDVFKKTDIKIKSSNISVQGGGAYGLYFDLLDPNTVAEYYGQEGIPEEPRITMGIASVYLSQTTFAVPYGTAIYATGVNGYGVGATLELSEGTKISGDLLLEAEKHSSISIKARDSSLTGAIRVDDFAIVDLQLMRGSTWSLTKSKYKDLHESDSTDSSLSSISLSDSTLVFNQNVSKGYQTLRIGSEQYGGAYYKKAYSAEGNVQIKLSAFLNDDGLFDPQKTDRILIYGDVSGTSVIHMQNFSKTSEKKISDENVNNEGSQSISIVQVSGTAQEDSFKLANTYTTVNGFPYQYHLRGYGPSSSFGEADLKNRLVAGDGKFWDFRLEAVYVDPQPDSSEIVPVSPTPSPSDPVKPSSPQPTPISPTPSPFVPSDPGDPTPIDPVPTPSTPVSPTPSPSVPSDPEGPTPTDPIPTPSTPVSPTPSPSEPSDPIDPSPIPPAPVKPDIRPEPGIRAVVPQLPTYLLLPNTLFHAGLMDLTSQNKKLETMRSTSRRFLKSDEDSAFFIRGYGGTHHYASDLSAFEYGYGAELDYTALEAGVVLKEIESLYSRKFFGIMGTYGNLSLHPLDVDYSKKSTFDKWSVAAYGSLQHDRGVYMDGVFSYGLFRGDVFTLLRGKTATLKGKQLSASLTSGKTFVMRHKGVFFDPQIQLIYQNLQFDRVHDVDNLDVDLGKFDQWTVRVGGRLTKIVSASEKNQVISFYGRLYLSHSFDDRQSVYFKKDFHLGAFGSSLEGGLGFNAQLSSKFVLHGDIAYQHQLTKAGFSGASFSASLRRLF